MVKLLVVDDEAAVCKLIADFFKRRGYAVFTVSDAAKVLDTIEKEQPQIILLDILMPGASGLDILKQIRAKYPRENVKIIMLTMVIDEAVKEEAIKLGADSYIKKPFSTNYLEEVVMRKIEELMGYSKIEEKKDAGS